MRSTLLLLALLLAGCASHEGDPQWATVTYLDDRGTWGCFTSVITDRGMVLTRNGCMVPEGTRICVQAIRQPRTPDPARWLWEPADTCGPRTPAPGCAEPHHSPWDPVWWMRCWGPLAPDTTEADDG